MKKLLILTVISLFAYVAKAQVFDYQIKGWQLQVDTTYTSGDLPQEKGNLYWNDADGTVDLNMGKVTQQIGQELPLKAYNNTGSIIPEGTPVYISGRHGHLPEITPARSDAESTSCIFGITTTTFGTTGDLKEGFVTILGYVRQIKTNYSGSGNWGTTWVENDKLYVSKTVAGQLTNVEPSAPHHSDVVATVSIVGAVGTGSILVLNQKHVTLQELTDVNGTPLTTKGQIPVWDEDHQYFDFDYNIWPDLISNEAYGVTWDGVDSVAPSKNAIYDKIESMASVSYCPITMTVNRGTLVAGTAADLCDVGGTDVQITELSGTDPLRVTFGFTGVTKLSSFVFYGDYNGGASHILWVEAYNYNTSAWDYLGQFMTSPTKAWYSFPIYNSTAYISSTNVQVRINHQGTGVNTHNLYLDYVNVQFGGGGGQVTQPDTLFTTIAISDETTALTTGTAKRTFRMPEKCIITKVRASVSTAPTGATLIFDINEGGTSILSTKLSIDTTEKTSKTAATPPVISDSSIADDAEMTIDIDQIGSTIAGTGAKIILYYLKN